MLVGTTAESHTCTDSLLVVADLPEGLAAVSPNRRFVAVESQYEGRGLHVGGSVTILGHGRGGVSGRHEDGEESLLTVEPGSTLRIHGFSFAYNPLGAAISCSGAELHLDGVSISGNQGSAIAGDCDIELEHSVIDSNREGVFGRFLKVQNSRLVDNGDGAVLYGASDHVDIRNNFIARNGRGGYAAIIQLELSEGGPPGIIAFNTLVNNSHNGRERGFITCGGSVDTNPTDHVTVDSNIIWRHAFPEGDGGWAFNHISGCYVGANVMEFPFNLETITEDPSLEIEHDDYQLPLSSSAVNVGSPSLTLEADLKGRIRDGFPDMGAVEAF